MTHHGGRRWFDGLLNAAFFFFVLGPLFAAFVTFFNRIWHWVEKAEWPERTLATFKGSAYLPTPAPRTDLEGVNVIIKYLWGSVPLEMWPVLGAVTGAVFLELLEDWLERVSLRVTSRMVLKFGGVCLLFVNMYLFVALGRALWGDIGLLLGYAAGIALCFVGWRQLELGKK